MNEINFRRTHWRYRHSCPSSKSADVNSSFWYMKFLVISMDNDLLTSDHLSELELHTTKYESGMSIFPILKLNEQHRVVINPYSKIRSIEMRSWYTYIRKLMGIYNTPRPDLEERQLFNNRG